MKEKEFNLSEKIVENPNKWKWYKGALCEDDIKEFIKINWKNQCHFIWDLVEIIKERYKLDISDLWTEKQIEGLNKIFLVEGEEGELTRETLEKMPMDEIAETLEEMLSALEKEL